MQTQNQTELEVPKKIQEACTNLHDRLNMLEDEFLVGKLIDGFTDLEKARVIELVAFTKLTNAVALTLSRELVELPESEIDKFDDIVKQRLLNFNINLGPVVREALEILFAGLKEAKEENEIEKSAN